MAKKKILFECQHCGLTTPKWMGKCTNCGAWDSFVELNKEQQEYIKKTKSSSSSKPKAQSIQEIQEDEVVRFSSFDKELDNILGGGIVPGSLTLIGGSPGVGKSTLLLKTAANIARSGKNVLYVTGEESAGQIKLRANRLDANEKNLYLLSEIRLEQILNELEHRDYEFLIIDSIQTIYSEEISSAPGSVSQVRQITFELMRLAKSKELATFIIGHITKEGSIAGPRVLEHMVDTVLYFEGDKGTPFRILRAVKNRFGSTNEIGVFEMTEGGLKEVDNPSQLFLSERPVNVPGSVVTASLEGTRPLLVEIQALVSASNFGVPRRTALGVDYNRVNLLIAVLDKRLGMHLGGMDVFVNVVGGLKIDEPAVDMAVIAAIASSFKNTPVDPGTLVYGEVGLSGELRAISQSEVRIKEAAKLGLEKALVPMGNTNSSKESGIEIIGAGNVEEALEMLFF